MKTVEVFEPVVYNHKWEAVKDFEEGVELYAYTGNKTYQLVTTAYEILASCSDLHLKGLKQVTWKEETLEHINNCVVLHGSEPLASFACIDSFALSDEFVGMCHLVASLTDKPE